ncbi:hypothetical protein V6N13_132406 [Hibiscus sabdariffa]
MPMLGMLPDLRVLEVKTNGFIGEKMFCFAPCFPQLYTLRLWGLDNLEVFDGAMPSLRRLEIKNCRNLKMQLPDRLKTLVRLLFQMNVLFVFQLKSHLQYSYIFNSYSIQRNLYDCFCTSCILPRNLRFTFSLNVIQPQTGS